MSRPSLAMTDDASKRLTDLFAQDKAVALTALQSLTPRDYVLPTKRWANRITGRTMGDDMEEAGEASWIPHEAQDDGALKSQQWAVAGRERGVFDDLVISLPKLRAMRTCAPKRRSNGLPHSSPTSIATV